MGSIIKRSALEFHGRKPASNVAMIVNGEIVTWDDVMAARRAKMDRRIKNKRTAGIRLWKAWKLWIGWYGTGLMGGWQAMISPSVGDRKWVDRDRKWLKAEFMRLWPLLLPLGNDYEQWEDWKPAFAECFKRRSQLRKPMGVAYFWWNDYDAPRLSLKGVSPCVLCPSC